MGLVGPVRLLILSVPWGPWLFGTGGEGAEGPGPGRARGLSGRCTPAGAGPCFQGAAGGGIWVSRVVMPLRAGGGLVARAAKPRRLVLGRKVPSSVWRYRAVGADIWACGSLHMWLRGSVGFLCPRCHVFTENIRFSLHLQTDCCSTAGPLLASLQGRISLCCGCPCVASLSLEAPTTSEIEEILCRKQNRGKHRIRRVPGLPGFLGQNY